MPFLWQQPHLLSGPLLSLYLCLWQQLRQKWNANVANYARVPHTLQRPAPALTCQLLTMQSLQRRQRLSHSSASFFLLFSLLFCLFGLLLCSYLCSKARAGDDAARFRAPGNSCQPGYVCSGWGKQLTHARRGGEGGNDNCTKGPLKLA